MMSMGCCPFFPYGAREAMLPPPKDLRVLHGHLALKEVSGLHEDRLVHSK